jgi:putative sterol carrier protein
LGIRHNERIIMPEEKDDAQHVVDAEDSVPAHERLIAEEEASGQPRRNGDRDPGTWTNQPAGGAAQEEPLDDLDDEEEEEQQPAPRKVIQNGKDVLCEELPDRAQRAKLRLKPYLTGALAIELTNSGERFLFDWRGDEPKVTPLTKDVTLTLGEGSDPSMVECVISISEQSLMAVRSGDLNPQVAMLADKIRVRGKVGPAVYLFNLVAPRFRT